MTVAEVAAATGETKEDTYFAVPTGAAAILRPVPGFENHDESSCV